MIKYSVFFMSFLFLLCISPETDASQKTKKENTSITKTAKKAVVEQNTKKNTNSQKTSVQNDDKKQQNQGDAVSSKLQKKVKILLSVPRSSTNREDEAWFGALCEEFMYFRLSAHTEFELIPYSTVHDAMKIDSTHSQNRADFYDRLALRLEATHIISVNYESTSANVFHWYMDLTSLTKPQTMIKFERNIDVEHTQEILDSAFQWVLEQTLVSGQDKSLKRFHALKIVSNDQKTSKLIGKILVSKETATKTQRVAYASELLQVVNKNPHNLLAQEIAASLFEMAGSYDKAVEQYQVLLNILPEHCMFYSSICRNLRFLKKYSEALSYAIAADKKGYIHYQLLLEGALTLEAYGKYDKAEKAFTILVNSYKDQPTALLFFARQASRKKNHSETIQWCLKVLKIDPQNAEALVEMGRAYRTLKEYSQAEKALNQALSLVPSDPLPAMLLAEMCLSNKQNDKAAAYFEIALKRDKENLSLYLRTAETWSHAEQTQKALGVLQLAEPQFKDSLRFQKAIASSYMLSRDTTNALKYLEQIFKNDGQNIETILTIAAIYSDRKLYDRAYFMYQNAISQSQFKNRGQYELAKMLVKKGDYDAAIPLLKELINKKCTFPHLYQLYGDAFFAKNNISMALPWYQKAIQKDSVTLYLQTRVALCHFLQQDYAKALVEYTTLSTMTTLDAGSQLHLAISLLYNNQVEQAEPHVKNVVSKTTLSGNELHSLARAYAFAKAKDQCIHYYKLCLASDSTNAKAMLELSEIYLKDSQYVSTGQLYCKLFTLDTATYSSLLGKAGLLFEQGFDTSAAHKAFSTFVKSGYKDSIIFLHSSRLQFAQKQYDTVIYLVERLPSSLLKDSADLLMVGQSYNAIGKYAQAIPWLEKLIEKYPQNSIANLAMIGVSYEKTKNWSNCIKTYQKLSTITSGEQQSLYLFMLASTYEQADKQEEAMNQYRENIGIHPQDYRNYQYLIALLVKKELWAEARLWSEQAIEAHVGDAQLIKQVADYCLKLNDVSAAIKYLKMYLETNQQDEEALVKLADIYFSRNLYEKALTYYEPALRINPNNFTTLFQVACSHHNIRNEHKALELFERANRQNPEHIETLNYLALCYRSLKMSEKLIATLTRLVKLQPDNYGAKVDLGLVLVNQSDTAQALKNLELACNLNPKDPDMHLLLATIYSAAKNDNARFSHLKKALDLSPENPEVLCGFGALYYERKSYQTAGQYIDKALQIKSNLPEALYYKAAICFEQKNSGTAQSAIKHAVTLEPYNPRNWLLYAKIDASNGQTELALDKLEKALSLDSTNGAILTYAARLYNESSKQDKAKDLLYRAISENDTCGECYTLLATIAVDNMQYQDALDLFTKALAGNKRDEQLLLQYGKTLTLAQRYDEASRSFEKILQINKNNTEAYYRLWHCYFTQNDLQKAEKLGQHIPNQPKTVWDHLIAAEQAEVKGNKEAASISYEVAIRIDPGINEAYAGRGRINLSKGLYSEAILNLSKALIKDPQNLPMQVQLGQAYEGLNQESSALELYNTVIDQNPRISQAYVALAHLREKENDHAGAVEILKKGIKENSISADLHYMLGMQYFKLSNYQGAVKAFEDAINKGSNQYLEICIQMACIYQNFLNKPKEAEKILTKYYKKGGTRDALVKYNLQNIGTSVAH